MWKDGKLLRRWREGESKYQVRRTPCLWWSGHTWWLFIHDSGSPGTLPNRLWWNLVKLGFRASESSRWFVLVFTSEKTSPIHVSDLNFLRDEKEGGYFFTPSESDVNLLVRIKEFIDDARPNSNAISALNLLQLSHITYRSEFSDRAARLLKVMGDKVLK